MLSDWESLFSHPQTSPHPPAAMGSEYSENVRKGFPCPWEGAPRSAQRILGAEIPGEKRWLVGGPKCAPACPLSRGLFSPKGSPVPPRCPCDCCLDTAPGLGFPPSAQTGCFRKVSTGNKDKKGARI